MAELDWPWKFRFYNQEKYGDIGVDASNTMFGFVSKQEVSSNVWQFAPNTFQ
jgi:hypothetical protein